MTTAGAVTIRAAAELAEALDQIVRQRAMYEMSRSDEMGLDAEVTVNVMGDVAVAALVRWEAREQATPNAAGESA